MRTLLIISFLLSPCFLFSQKISKKQIKKAEKHFEKCMEYAKEEKYDEAITQVGYAILENPKKIEYHLSKVNLFFAKEEIPKGMGYLNKTIDLFPEESIGYNTRGSLMDAVRYFELAIEDFTKAIEFAKNKKEKAIYYSNRGGSKSQIMDYTGAYDDLMEAYKLNPSNKDVLNNLAMVCDEVGKPEETLVYLNRIIELDSTYIPAYVNIGFKYQLMGEHVKAIGYFSKAIQLDPDEALGYSNISYSLLKVGRLDEAMKNINKSIELNPINPYAYRNRALIYLEKDEIMNACDDIEEGLSRGFSKSYGDELKELHKEHCVGKRN